MLFNLFTLLRYLLFWLLFFFLERLVFVLFFLEKLRNFSVFEISKSFLYGLWLDISTTGYLSVVPLLAFIFVWNVPKTMGSNRLLCLYIRTFVVLSAIITVINFNIYREWGSKVNSRAFDFLFSSPAEAIASSTSSPLLISFLVLALLIAIGFRLSALFTRSLRIDKGGSWMYKIPLSLLLLGLNFLAIRGGWQLAPVNESMAYYSSSPVLNHAAVNTDWSLLRSFKNGSGNKNPYQYFEKDEAQRIVQTLFSKPADSVSKILSTNKPNVVFIIQESFTADLVESLGGLKGVNPQMEKLISQGLLFENVYASGDRTDRGLVAILSAFPSQATKSIIKDNSKNAKLPSLYESFRRNGFYTSFYYGGESEFANIKSYFLNNECEELVDKSAFDEKDMNSKWGAYDNVVYDKLLNDLNKRPQPFFSTLLTLTHHEPFELPVSPHFKGERIEDKFKSTAYFADSCLGAFIDKAKQQSWYKNTLFIVVADHGHRLPKDEYEIYDSRRYRIPLFFFGEVIKPEFRGTKISKTASQTDIAATLLSQLNISSSEFEWSKDLLDPKVEGHAFYCWDNGFGFINEKKELVSFDNVNRRLIYDSVSNKEQTEVLVKTGKAYMQSVFQKYTDY